MQDVREHAGGRSLAVSEGVLIACLLLLCPSELLVQAGCLCQTNRRDKTLRAKIKNCCAMLQETVLQESGPTVCTACA